MYGARGAASNWEDCLMDLARDFGFNSSITPPCVFNHITCRLWLTVHGDDFTLLGGDENLDWLEKEIKANIEVKQSARTPRTRT